MFISINRSMAEAKARRENNEEGFTLIELLVVVLIIGVLSAIAIPIFLNQQKAAKISAIESDLSSAKTAIVAAMVSDPTFDITTFTDFSTLDGFKPSNDVTLAWVGPHTNTSFCITGTHSDVDDVAPDLRSVGDTGGVVKNGTCAAATTP